MSSADIQVVYAFHEALNSLNTSELAALATDDIEIGGPQGQGRGVDLLIEWSGRANIQLHPKRVFQRVDVAVVEQEAIWHTPNTEDVVGRQTVATMFRIRGGRIAAALRFPDLASALETAGLSHADEIS